MRRTARSRTGVVFLVGMGMIAAACGGGTSKEPTATAPPNANSDKVFTVALDEPSTEPTSGGSVVFGVVAESNSWSPVRGQWAGTGNLISQTFYDRLAMYDEDNTPQPYLASAIESNDTFDEWRITAREGVTFHDDTPLDGEAIRANLEAGRAAILTEPIFRLIESIEVDPADPMTAVLKMSAPWSTFPHMLTAQTGSIASPGYLATPPEEDADPIGTGPFEFVSWTRDNSLLVEKNDDYWREGFPKLDQIEFRVITDGGARASAMQSGDLDLMEAVESDVILNFFGEAQKGNYQIYLTDEGDTDENFVMFNTTKPPFDDPVLRRAAIQAIDTAAVAENVYDDVFVPARGPIAPSSEWYAETEYPPYDPAAAKAAIEKWELDNGRQMSFEANIPPDPSVLRIGQLMKDLASEVSVDVELNTIEQTQLILRAISGQYEATGFAQIFNVPHPDRMYPFLHSSSIPDDPTSSETSLNFPRYANADVDAALEGARTTDDREEQFEWYAKLQEALAADTPYLWMVHTKSAIVSRTDVRSLTAWELPDGGTGKPQLGTNVPLYQVWLDR